MTVQERCQELLPVIQAGAEGKELQYQDGGRGAWHAFKPHIATNFFCDSGYRIKPEPQYRPFTAQEAVLQAGSKIRNKRTGNVAELTAVSITTVWINECLTVVFEKFLEQWEFTDGSPCGVLVSS